MKKNNISIFFNNVLLQSIVFYIILSIFLFPFYKYQINPDGISYISIAQKYLLHDFGNAINGYWGPLLSWLLMPFLFIGLNSLIAAKLLSLAIGVMIVFQTNSLVKLFDINGLTQFFVSNVIVVVVIQFALSVITPDLLFVCLYLGIINLILNSTYENYKYAGSIIGILGSGLYLTKSYGFPFFIVTFSIVTLIFYFRTSSKEKRAKVISNFIGGMVVFFLISSIWILALSNKYGYLTIGTAGAYNHAIFGPNSLGHPMEYMGLIDPPNKTAISVWEDISYVKIQSWSIFDSYSSFQYKLKFVFINMYKIFLALNAFSFLSLCILIWSIVYLFKKGKQILNNNIFILMVILVILFSSYSMIIIESRYIWLSNILILIIGAKLINTIDLQKRLYKTGLLIIFTASFLVNPIWLLYSESNTGQCVSILNNKIRDLNIQGRIASSGDWGMSLYLSFYNDWSYYGDSFKDNDSELKAELEKKNIDYYFVWKPFDQKIKFIESYEDITKGKIEELRIYKLR